MSKTTTTRKKTTGAVRRKVSPAQTAVEALAKYEEALKLFRKGDYDKAIPLFEKITSTYPAEREIVDRSRIWMSAAQVRSSPAPAPPRDAGESHDRAVLAANDGEFDRAADLFGQVVSMEPGNDRGHYGLGWVCALREDAAGAVRHLRKAIEINPTNRVRAVNDIDFDAVREDPSFIALMGKAPEEGK